jgi:hypothetical protein
VGHFVLMALCRGPGIWVSSRPDYTRDPARAYRASRWCIRDSGAHATGLKSKVSPCPGPGPEGKSLAPGLDPASPHRFEDSVARSTDSSALRFNLD